MLGGRGKRLGSRGCPSQGGEKVLGKGLGRELRMLHLWVLFGARGASLGVSGVLCWGVLGVPFP